MSERGENIQGQSVEVAIPASASDLDSTARFDREELVKGWRAYGTACPRVAPILKFAAKTDMGQVRENNEDKFDFYEPEEPAILAERGSLFAVADGMGGALAGQIASEMMLKHVLAGYYNHSSPDPISAMRDAVVDANERIYLLAQMIPERSGMGTTLVALLSIEDRILITQVGDSRAYRIRNGEVEQITHDHSWVEEQVRAGLMSRSDAEMSPFRNVITRSVGATPVVQPDFYEDDAHMGDIWVLCSDGLTGHVSAEEIGQIASSYPPSEAARQFIELANSRGGRDNITVFILSIRDLIPFHEMSNSPVTGSSIAAPSMETKHPDRVAAQSVSEEPFAINSSEVTERLRSGWRKLFGK